MSTQTIPATKAKSVLREKMALLARKQLELERVEAELNTRVEALKGLYAGRIASLQSTVENMRRGIERLCRRERDALLGESARSLRTPHGRVGFRRCAARVALRDGADEAKVCAALRGRGLDELVRVKESPDRGAIRRAHEEGDLGDELLAECGLHVVEGEENFYCVLEKAEGAGR